MNIDTRFQKSIEKQVSRYPMDNITLVCFNVEDKKDWLRLEEGIIACLNHDRKFISSAQWFGRYYLEKTLQTAECG